MAAECVRWLSDRQKQDMFGIFKSKSPIEKLQKKYEKAMAEAHQLSAIDRKASDAKYQEAEEIVKEIELLKGEFK